MTIYFSGMRTPDGTFLVSRNRHDYVSYKDENGKHYFLDGGNDYIRSSANGDEVYITVTEETPFEVARQYVSWGTRGIKGDQPLRYVPIDLLTSGHIHAIIRDHEAGRQPLATQLRLWFRHELEYRGHQDPDNWNKDPSD